MTQTLNPKYTPPSRDKISNTLIPAWYAVEKNNVVSELKHIKKAAITCDGWTSITRDHYLTVTLHYVYEDRLHQKVLKTQAVYEAQTGPVVADEIEVILKEFSIDLKDNVGVTVDNAYNMDAAVRRLKILKLGCFAHTLNLGAQKAYSVLSVSKWAAKIRTIIVWMRKSSMAKVVLKEKQQLLSLQPHKLVLDVKTRWNSTYLMTERFVEQYPAIQATVRDPRVRKGAEKDKLERMSDEDFKKADEFIKLMRILYTSTLAVSSEKTPTCGQILPILKKLETHFTAADDDSVFTASIKAKIWSDLSTFLEEATIMDPRFRAKLDNNAAWDQVKDAAVKMAGPEESE
ncbi:zinc finger BED domain-containing protein 4-like, partial [Epinephelus lanceolatus]